MQKTTPQFMDEARYPDELEVVKNIGEIALKLEEYRYRITSALAWVIFGMLFASFAIIYNVLLMFRAPEWTAIVMAIPGIVGFVTYLTLRKYVPISRGKKIARAFLIMVLPFIISYSILPLLLHLSTFYYSVAWYPSLGAGLISAGLTAKPFRNSLTYSGVLILVSSAFLLLLPPYPIPASLTATSMMLVVYLVTFLYDFITAQRVVYA